MAKKSMDEVKHLIDLGKEKGFLTYDEVNDLLPPDIVSSDQIDDVMSMFGEMDIEVVDSAQKVKIPKVKLDLEEEDELEGEQEEVEFEPGVLGRTSDPVRMYLREMGSVSLLTREGEVEIAKRIEEGDRDVARVIYNTPITVKEVIDLGDMLEKFQINAADISKEVEEEELEEDEEDVQKTRLLSVIGDIRSCDATMEQLQHALLEPSLVAGDRERLVQELHDLKLRTADLLKSLRLKDRHIERIALRLKELAIKVNRIMAEIHEVSSDSDIPVEELTVLCHETRDNDAARAKFLSRLASSSEEALKMEKKLRSAQKKLEKIEQDSGFVAFELEKEIKGNDSAACTCASFRTALHATASKDDQRWNPKPGLVSPGARREALNAASTGIVPDPHMGSTRGTLPSQPLNSIIAAASVSRKGASFLSRRYPLLSRLAPDVSRLTVQ
jgi:RNA polymerase primary sigma factor